MTNMVYTIGREFGSGGRNIGKKLADKLGIKFYDKELLTKAASESGLCEDIFHLQDEKPTSSFLYSLVSDTYAFTNYNSGTFMDMPLSQKVFLAQFDTIKKIAREESCVIVGRCADYALAEVDNVVNTFIYADLDDRVQKKANELCLPANKAKDIIVKTDKQRANYYNFYTNKKWGDSRSYDLCLNSSRIGEDGCVDAIIDYTNIYKKHNGII